MNERNECIFQSFSLLALLFRSEDTVLCRPVLESAALSFYVILYCVVSWELSAFEYYLTLVFELILLRRRY